MLPAHVAVVLGGGAGIGAAVAERLSATGSAIVIVDYVDGRAQARADILRGAGALALGLVGDATHEADVQEAAQRTLTEFGRVDVLVNCSGGILTRSNVEAMTLADWEHTLATNLTSLFLSSRAVLPAMRRQGSGSIVGLSSEYAWGTLGAAHYAAAKAGVLGFVRSLAREVAEYGIRVNAVAPGIVATERVVGEMSPEAIAARNARIPMGRFGEPTEAADAIVFLAGDAARYITGQVLHVNGGALMP